MNARMIASMICLLLGGCPDRDRSSSPPPSGGKAATPQSGTKAKPSPTMKPGAGTPGTGTYNIDTEGPAARPENPVVKPKPGACIKAYHCAFRRKGCCHPCRETPLSEIEALTLAQHKAKEKACLTKLSDQICQKCKQGKGFNPNFIELCKKGKCAVDDIRKAPFSACDKDADCYISTKICCDCYTEPVAVGAKGKFRMWRCSEGQHCEPCEAPGYVGLSAKCVRGHCVLKGKWDKNRERKSIRRYLK